MRAAILFLFTKLVLARPTLAYVTVRTDDTRVSRATNAGLSASTHPSSHTTTPSSIYFPSSSLSPLQQINQMVGTRVVRVGCGAGFQGDRVSPAVQLMKEGTLDYLVLECLADRTLADSIERKRSGGPGMSFPSLSSLSPPKVTKRKR